jgi:cold shock CspA family protein
MINIRSGTIKTYKHDKGFGFVTVSNSFRDDDVFFHISNVKNIESQLAKPSLTIWFETSTNNRGTYVSKAWASRDEIPLEYLKVLTEQEEKAAARKRALDAERDRKINGTQEERNAREVLLSKVTYLGLCTDPREEEGIRSLCVTPKLYEILEKHMREYRLRTTSYNHGKGVDRVYTHNYCLQRTYSNSGTNYYIKKGGRPFPRSVDKTKYSNKTVQVCTPSFADMCHGILRDYRSDVRYINR